MRQDALAGQEGRTGSEPPKRVTKIVDMQSGHGHSGLSALIIAGVGGAFESPSGPALDA